MDFMTVGEVSSAFQVSARMLRYYEKEGLIQSTRKEGYAYRIYDAEAVRRVRQILILRKLQVPLKRIRGIMEGSREEAVRLLKADIAEREESAAAMDVMKRALERLLEWLETEPEAGPVNFVQDDALIELTEPLPLKKHSLREEKRMRKAKEMAEKGNFIRIIQLPPCTVAAYQFEGDAPEEAVGAVMDEFVRSSGLYEKKPDARLFGFNHPDMAPGSEWHGYEDWVTIPDDMEPPAPLVKKHFPGGWYAAYTIRFPEFQEWAFLREWVDAHEIYQADYHDEALRDMGGCLEEHLNWVYCAHMGWPENGPDGKLDLLLPIRRR